MAEAAHPRTATAGFGCTGLEDVENYLNEWHGQEELPRLIEECAQAVSDEASG